MSISATLSNALSGLVASSRAADVAASNISNTMTEGYGVRRLGLAARSIGDEGGVRVTGILRHTNAALLADRREAEAYLAEAAIGQAYAGRMEVAMGLPTEPGSLADRLARLEASLTEATRAPENESHLRRVVEDFQGLISHISSVSDAIQLERQRADGMIAASVTALNDSLQILQELNAKIGRHQLLGHDVSALLDQQQRLVDQVNEVIPVRVLERSQGGIALMAQGGTLLLDGPAAEVSFAPTPLVTAYQSLSGGTLSGLEINGRVVDTAASSSPIAGGKLAALFRVRDEAAVDLLAQLDGFSRDLVERFADPSVDPSLPAGAPPLLTDNGSVFAPANELGLSQRLELNMLVVPDLGGQVWRLRDGLGAALPGPEGQSAGLLRLAEALSSFRPLSSTAFGTGDRTASGLAAELSSSIGAEMVRADGIQAFASAQFNSLKELELAEGVDTDAEMQRLLLIEQAYSANARVIQVADEMLDWLMRIGA